MEIGCNSFEMFSRERIAMLKRKIKKETITKDGANDD